MSEGLFASFTSTSDRLQLLYADAAPSGVGAWRITLGFAAPTADRPASAPQIPPSAIRIRSTWGERAELEAQETAWIVPGRVLAVDAALAGGSTVAGSYLIRVDAPARVDPAACVARFVLPDPGRAPAAKVAPLDYLTKDYAGFRELLLSGISRRMPDWVDRDEADLGVTIVESLAYAADFLSYYQDAVATEAYLETARQRASVRRHLRLLGATLSEGCASRAFIRLQVSQGDAVLAPAGARYVALAGDPPVVDPSDTRLLRTADRGVNFTQIEDLTLLPALNRLPLAVENQALRAGAVHFPVVVGEEANLARTAPGRIFGVIGVRWSGGPTVLHPFRVKSVELTGAAGRDARQIAVLVAERGDALPWGLLIGPQAEVTGNLALAEFGEVIHEEPLPAVVAGEPYQPILAKATPVPVAMASRRATAAALMQPDPAQAVAAITLRQFIPDASGRDGFRLDGVWRCVPDLLQSPPDARHFVAETQPDGRVQLRFGDGVFGRSPAPGSAFFATYRYGDLSAALVGQDELKTLIPPPGADVEGLLRRVRAVGNPAPSKGRALPDGVRAGILRAKAGFRIVGICATVEDYVAAAQSTPGVAEAVVRLARRGAVVSVEVCVRPTGGLFVSEPLLTEVSDLLRSRLIAGRRVRVAGPRFARLDLALRVETRPGASKEAVGARVRRAFSPDGGGLFAPENLRFAAPVFESRVLEQVLGVEGVARAEVLRLARSGRDGTAAMLRLDWNEIATVGAMEIRLESAA